MLHLLNLKFLTQQDILLIPLFIILSFYSIKKWAKNKDNAPLKNIILRAYSFKITGVILFLLITEFYFKGGDTNLYYQALKDMRMATQHDITNLPLILKSAKLEQNSTFFNFFFYDGFDQDLTWNYMLSNANYSVPRIALLPSYFVGMSFFGLCLVFGIFSFLGAVRLFKVFISFYPNLKREFAFVTLFLPSVVFWSSGLLKDSITFGCIGFFLGAFFDLVFRRSNVVIPAFILLLTGYLIFIIKPYIILAIIFCLIIWAFSQTTQKVRNRPIRYLLNVSMISLSIVLGLQTVNTITAYENAKEFKLTRIFQNAESERDRFTAINSQLNFKDSYFTINTNNSLTTATSGFFATFYRPFLWEINTPIAILSFLEATMFLFLTIHFIRKKGFLQLFIVPFADTKILFCFAFALTYATAVGISSTNFGALSRYKIPCMPFFLAYLILIIRHSSLALPRWFSRILDIAVPRSLVYAKN